MRRRLRSNNSTILKLAMVGIVAMAGGFLLTSLMASKGETQALSATEFQPGRIIDDSIFYNPNTMTAAEIDAFIDSHNPACDMWGTQKVYGNVTRAEYVKQLRASGNTKYHDPPFVCISEYYENPETHKTNFSTGGKKEEGMLSAGEIIYKAAQEYSINPQVLLVMLKKESYVWGDDWPHNFQYNTVMGYACPDGAPCDTKYYGFYNQVMMAAWQLNYYRDHIYSYNYRPYTTNNILYNPDRSCGSKSVYLENIATTSLYIYTPYVPNDAALANYPGTSWCGSYGNRNFYMYFREWFGETIINYPSATELKSKPDKTDATPSVSSDLDFNYSAHVQNVGWIADSKAGQIIGSTGYGLGIEALKITLPSDVDGSIEYRSYIHSKGWEETYKTSSQVSGTTGQSLQIEAFQARLTGELAKKYELQYRAHIATIGWQSWVGGDTIVGKENSNRNIEALQIKLVKRPEPIVTETEESETNTSTEPKPGASSQEQGTAPVVAKIKTVSYRAHVQDFGWQGWVDNGISGTTGRSKRLEAIEINLDNEVAKRFGIKYRAHVQDIGWQDWVENGQMAGTTGRFLRMEALEIKLDDEAAKIYKLQYRAHVQDIGWQDWVENGQMAGTTGQSKRLEAIEIKLIKR